LKGTARILFGTKKSASINRVEELDQLMESLKRKFFAGMSAKDKTRIAELDEKIASEKRRSDIMQLLPSREFADARAEKILIQQRWKDERDFLIDSYAKASTIKAGLVPQSEPQQAEMSRHGRGWWQGRLDPFGIREKVTESMKSAREFAALGQRQISLPEKIGGFSGTIQTAIGTMKVGVPDTWEKIEQSSYRQETTANRIARLAQESKDLAKETAQNTEKTADNTSEEPIT